MIHDDGGIGMEEYDLSRFLDAQKDDYETALKEIRNGHKRSHWIWYVFPQLKGLGRSYNSSYYGIKDIEEAKAYLENQTLGRRLREISEALLSLESCDPYEVMGHIDALKLQSSMTLFNEVSENDVFRKVLDKYYGGKYDELTLKMLHKENLSD